ncbi:hypothetical protein OROMI_026298 [Orobanche minor]
MDSTVEISESGSDIVGEKRAVEEDVDVLKEGSPSKRARGVSERNLVADVKKVAEMVLVLAAMGKMRGGKGPTGVEKELMVEARNRLAKVCEGFAPKDVFPRDAFGGVIEDLGLNKFKEQRLGFRPPKLSIAEKLLVFQRKYDDFVFSKEDGLTYKDVAKASGAGEPRYNSRSNTSRGNKKGKNTIESSSKGRLIDESEDEEDEIEFDETDTNPYHDSQDEDFENLQEEPDEDDGF